MFQKISGIQKLLCTIGGMVSRFSVENILSHSTENFRWGTLLCFRKFRYRKILCRKKGYHYFLLKFFGLTAEKLRRGTLLCSRKFLISQNFMDKIGGGGGGEGIRFGGGGYHVSPSRTFCLTVPKNFVRKPFCVSKKFWYRKFSCIGGGGITILSNIFCLTGTKQKTL